MDIKLYKIKHKDIGLYSRGGSHVHDRPYNSDPQNPKYGHWSKKGKIWQGSGPLRAHLAQYCSTYKRINDVFTRGFWNEIPDTWIIEEQIVSEGVTYQYLARDFYENKNPTKI